MELEEKEWKANLVLVSQYINFGGFNFITGDLFIFGFSIYSISNSSNSYITLGCLTYFFINGNSAFSIKFYVHFPLNFSPCLCFSALGGILEYKSLLPIKKKKKNWKCL